MPSDLNWLIISTLFFLVGITVTYWVHHQQYIRIVIPRAEQPHPSAAPLVSVIVPARNEARNIRRSVEALDSQDYPNLELIVVDDRSTDNTSRILEDIDTSRDPEQGPALTIVPGVDLPPGWAGKPHAIFQGISTAQGEWLCFIDADTFAHPALLSSAFQAAQNHNADLLTILTDQKLSSFWEKVIMPLVFTGLSVGFPADRVNDPAKPDAIANGQFIFIRRSVYDAVGGHQAIRSEIAEDKALAELVKGSGYRLVLGDGRQLAQTRMYTSLPEIWEGWTKNIYLGLRERIWLLAIGAATGLVGAILLPFWTVTSFLLFFSSGSWMASLAAIMTLLLWGYLFYQRIKACQALQINPWYSLTLPLGALIFTAMMFASAYKVLSGKGITWRGRSYS